MFTNQDPDLWENVKRTNENPQIFDVQMWGSGNSGIGHNQPQRNGITNKQPDVTQCGYSTAKVGIQPTIAGIHDDLSTSSHLKQFLWIFSTIFSNNHGGRRQLHDKMQTKTACFQDLLQAWLPNPELFDHYLKLL